MELPLQNEEHIFSHLSGAEDNLKRANAGENTRIS